MRGRLNNTGVVMHRFLCFLLPLFALHHAFVCTGSSAYGMFLLSSLKRAVRLTDKSNAVQASESVQRFYQRLANSHLRYNYSDTELKNLSCDFGCIEQQAEAYASTHVALYHGSLATPVFLMQTLRSQLEKGRQYENFWLLRDEVSTETLRYLPSASGYAKRLIKQRYQPSKGLERFDNNKELKKLFLSANLHLMNNFEQGTNEDSLSFCLEDSRFQPAIIPDTMEELLRPYHLDYLTRYELTRRRGCIIQILLPKKLLHLTYISYPFGIPVPLPQPELLSGRLSNEEMLAVLEAHEDVSVEGYLAMQTDDYQARILLDPAYFNDPARGILMNMYLYTSDEKINHLLGALGNIFSPVG